VLRELTTRDPRNAEGHYNLGVALKQKDDFTGAEAALRHAVDLGALAEAPFTLGVVLWQTGKPHEAIDMFRQAIARRAAYDDALFMLGTVLQQTGDGDAALAAFREVIRLRPSSAEAHLSLGRLLQERDDRPGAAAAFEEARRLNQKKADVQASTFAVGVGRGRAGSGDLGGAVEQFERAVALAPENFEAHYELAKAFTILRRPDAARTHLLEARRLAPHLRFRDP
jgi:tetratricopeptide (TPR) repeat protein